MNDPLVRKFRAQYDRLATKAVAHADPVGSSSTNDLDKTATPVFDLVRAAMWILECDEQCSQGTAFLLKDHGLITCAHVISCGHAQQGKMKAFRSNAISTKYVVQIDKVHETIDLAILRIDAPSSPALEMSLEDGLGDHTSIYVCGFPNFRPGDTGSVMPGHVVGHRIISTFRRAQVSASIVTGASGGPVVNNDGVVVGVAVTGAGSMEEAPQTENHGVIPIQELEHVLESKTIAD